MIKDTSHKIHFKSAENLSELADNSVSLVVTSPPYPMIEMWDKSFSEQDSEIGQALLSNKPERAFELMHRALDKVWQECYRVLSDGGVACINIGDATRTIDKKFQLFSNHARIISAFVNLGFSNLPNVIWRKQTNAPNKFMGSGMYPPGAYVTLEHEFILVFRKGNKREFSAQEKHNRRESAYFWEERNIWFSDLWDLKGTTQLISKNGARDRSGAYPFEIPYRLINMFSAKGDTVLDPFIGTGTTTLAAMASGRNSVGYEFEPEFSQIIEKSFLSEPNHEMMNHTIRKRLEGHKKFVSKRIEEKGRESLKHVNEWFNFPVMTRQEKDLVLQFVEGIEKCDNDFYKVCYVQEALMDYFENHSVFSQSQIKSQIQL